MKKTPLLFAVLFSSSFWGITLALADTYSVSMNAGLSKLNNFCNSLASGFTCSDSAPVFGLDGGYQFNNLFGLELAYANYGQTKKSGLLFGSVLDITQTMSGLRLSGTLTYPLSTSFALTGKLGVSSTDLDIISTLTPGPSIPAYAGSSTSAAFGIGVQYKISEAFAIRAQYENLGRIGDATIGTDTLSILTLGLTYRFSKSKPRKATQKRVDQTKTLPIAPAAAPPLRVILFLERSPAEDKLEITAAIKSACQCEPNFVRLYNAKALVYEITLAPGQTFVSFKGALLASDTTLGFSKLSQGQ